MKSKQASGMTEEQELRLTQAVDGVMTDIEAEEYGVTPVAGLEGIDKDTLRLVVQRHLRQAHLHSTVQEGEITRLQEQVAVVTGNARKAIREAETKAWREAEQLMKKARLSSAERLEKAQVDLDVALESNERLKGLARKNLERAIRAEKAQSEVQEDAQNLLGRIREFMSQWRKGAK